MNRADIIPVITECRILLPGLFEQGPRQCLFKRLDEGRRKDLNFFFFRRRLLQLPCAKEFLRVLKRAQEMIIL